ncbi:MAG: DUF1566 domain-containing protein [bacterium]
MEKENQSLVIDHTTGLTWQQSGSSDSMVFKDAQAYIQKLNDENHSGYSDWRLPTLEEAMSLIELEKKEGNLYIESVFDKKQGWIWTADKTTAGSVWFVLFTSGDCNVMYPFTFKYDASVRAVRS